MGSVDTETEIKCPKCKKMINRDRAAKNKYVCYECGYYFRVKTYRKVRGKKVKSVYSNVAKVSIR